MTRAATRRRSMVPLLIRRSGNDDDSNSDNVLSQTDVVSGRRSKVGDLKQTGRRLLTSHTTILLGLIVPTHRPTEPKTICTTTVPVGTRLHLSSDSRPVWVGWDGMASVVDGRRSVAGELK